MSVSIMSGPVTKVKRKQAVAITYEMKLKVIRDFDESGLSKSELGILNGISATSVSRILNCRKELEAMTHGEVKKRTNSSDSRSQSSHKPKVKRKRLQDTTNNQNSGNKDTLSIQFDDPEASFEKALKQLGDYTFQLLECDLLFYNDQCAAVDDLYELYEELMETELTMI